MLFALLVAAAIVFVGMGLQALAWNIAWFRSQLLHVALASAVLTLALRAPLEGMARAQLGDRGPVALWSAMAVAAIAQAAVLALELDETLVYRYGFLTSARHLWEVQPDAAVIPIAGFIAARVATEPIRLERSRRASLARLATAAACALLLLGIVRAVRATPIDDFVRSLPRIATVSPIRGGESERGADTRESVRYDDTHLPTLVLRRYAFAERSVCVWRAAPSADRLPTVTTIQYDNLLSCNDVTVREHRESGTIIVSSPRSSSSGEWDDRLAFRASDGAGVRDASAPAIRRALSVPTSWIPASALLLAGALAQLFLGRRAARELASSASWQEGTLRADSMIELADKTLVAAPYGLDLPAGPVVLTAPVAQKGAAFRDGAVQLPLRSALRAGSIADAVGAIEAKIDAHHAAALFAAIASASPWIAALFARLLF